MLPLGLSGAEQRRLHRTLIGNHRVKTRVTVMNLEGDSLRTITPRFLDGQINVADGPVSRSLTATILDPSRTLNFDSSNPSDGALYADRMLRVTVDVLVPGDGWVAIPCFTGPVTKFDRTDAVVTVECQGKEALSMGQLWRPLTIKKGTKKTDALRRILARTGENRFSIPDLAEKLPKDLSLGRESQPWLACLKIARSMNRQLYYDGRGVCRLRKYPGNALFTFTERDSITTPPTASFSANEFHDVIWVKGGRPKGTERRSDDDGTPNATYVGPGVRAAAVAPNSHPLTIDRNGQRLFHVRTIDDDHIRSIGPAQALANRELDDSLRQDVAMSFDAIPVYHLDPGDWVRCRTSSFVRGMRLNTFSLPLLVTNGSMSVGYASRRSVRRNRIR